MSDSRCERCGGPLSAGGQCGRCALGAALLASDSSGALPSLSASDEASLQRLAGYQILEELGRGGMGRVYRARDPGLGREVAIKVLTHDVGERARERFLREGRALAQLRDPHVVEVHDVGREGALSYLVLSLVRGESLHRRVEADGPLPPREAVDLAATLARTLARAHAVGVLHRDLTPANVLLDDAGRPVLVDFGLALLEGEVRLSQSGLMMGTPGFLAPEQALARPDDVGPASDVFGLGATLYYALTGEPPLPARRDAAGSFPRPPRPSARGAGDARLDAIVLRCLEPDPGQRYPSAQELEKDLVAWRPDARRVPRALALGLLAALLPLALAGGWRLASRRAPPPSPSSSPTPQVERTPAGTARGRARVHNLEGMRLAKAGRLEEALAAFDRALAEDDHVSEVWFNRALVLGNLGREEEEEDSYGRVLWLNPGYVKARYNRAHLRSRWGDYEGALADLDYLLEHLTPDDVHAILLRINVLNKLGRPEDAVPHVEHAVRVAPNMAEPYLLRGILRYAEGRLEEAQADLQRCEARDPHGELASEAEALRRRLEQARARR